MSEHKTSVMIALLPMRAEWSRIDIPHLTLVFAGKTEDHTVSSHNELLKDAASISAVSSTLRLETNGTDIFGGNGDPEVEVLKMKHDAKLWAMRRFVERWNKSEYDFSPHITVGPPGTIFEIPNFVIFNQIMVGFGDQRTTFNLKS